MTIATDIIRCQVPNFDAYIQAGESLDDIDEYGFTPLIESIITRQHHIANMLIERGVDVNKKDIAGRTPLHWAVDNQDLKFTQLLLEHGAEPNAYTSYGMSVLVYPLLRSDDKLKQLLFEYGAILEPAQDYILAKLIGHRFELPGYLDIVNASNEFIEVNYEGFILEFTVAIIKASLNRFMSNYSTKHLRSFFPTLHTIIDGLDNAEKLLNFQHIPQLNDKHFQSISRLIHHDFLILPAASRGHALGFIKYKHLWVKVDRGENSLKEGCVNFYTISNPKAFNVSFIHDFLYSQQPREYFHQTIDSILGLRKVNQLPMNPQISGNCSWANIQAIIPASYALLNEDFPSQNAMHIYEQFMRWDQDRAIDECIQKFYLANDTRKASLASMLGAILFHALDETKKNDITRAEKILKILLIPKYYYILNSYLEVYCVEKLTRKGNNLLKLLEHCNIDPKINVTPIATGLKPKDIR